MALPRSADSPGQVTFLHETHVTPPAGLHNLPPRLFSILKQVGGAKRVPLVHAEMEKVASAGLPRWQAGLRHPGRLHALPQG